MPDNETTLQRNWKKFLEGSGTSDDDHAAIIRQMELSRARALKKAKTTRLGIAAEEAYQSQADSVESPQDRHWNITLNKNKSGDVVGIRHQSSYSTDEALAGVKPSLNISTRVLEEVERGDVNVGDSSTEDEPQGTIDPVNRVDEAPEARVAGDDEEATEEDEDRPVTRDDAGSPGEAPPVSSLRETISEPPPNMQDLFVDEADQPDLTMREEDGDQKRVVSSTREEVTEPKSTAQMFQAASDREAPSKDSDDTMEKRWSSLLESSDLTEEQRASVIEKTTSDRDSLVESANLAEERSTANNPFFNKDDQKRKQSFYQKQADKLSNPTGAFEFSQTTNDDGSKSLGYTNTPNRPSSVSFTDDTQSASVQRTMPDEAEDAPPTPQTERESEVEKVAGGTPVEQPTESSSILDRLWGRDGEAESEVDFASDEAPSRSTASADSERDETSSITEEAFEMPDDTAQLIDMDFGQTAPEPDWEADADLPQRSAKGTAPAPDDAPTAAARGGEAVAAQRQFMPQTPDAPPQVSQATQPEEAKVKDTESPTAPPGSVDLNSFGEGNVQRLEGRAELFINGLPVGDMTLELRSE